MRLNDIVKRSLQHLGVDIRRFPQHDPHHQVARLLGNLGVDTVLDVGANAGSYARTLRKAGWRGDMHSYEPVSSVFRHLQSASARDPRWHAHHTAIGAIEGHAAINIAGNNAASSSILKMTNLHSRTAPQANFVGEEVVPITTLDQLWPNSSSGPRRFFLKVDVQGFEMEVLRGAERLLRDRIVGAQLEMSLAELYDGALGWRDLLDHICSFGYDLVGLLPGHADFERGRLLQFDGLFVNSDLGI